LEGQSLVAVVVTPKGTVEIARRGVYRFDVTADETSVTVHKGRLVLAGRLIKDGKKAVLENGAAALIAEAQATDSFELWSKERAKVLIAANRRLTRRSVFLARSFNSWLYDPFSMCYTYLPMSRCSSPYGGGYSTCYTNYYPRNPYTPVNNGGGSTVGSWSSASSGSISRPGGSSSSSSSTISTPRSSSSSSPSWGSAGSPAALAGVRC
jgi:hypothetical protein